MDSWYLYHILLNLSRLAEKGDEDAKKIFLDSLDYAIRVAHQFKYHWPVFYKMDTLEVLQSETSPGNGGELDVACVYSLVMMQAFDATGDRRYLREAEKAAKTLKGLGFKLAYQLNDTIFGADAFLRLFIETGDEYYRDLSYVCMANVLNFSHLWECDYGYGQYYPTFFALYPLKDAPYTAAYEEIDLIGALHDYVLRVDQDILPSLRLFMAEMLKNLVYRSGFYYPPLLPKEVMTDKPKTGRIDPKMWLPLEDIHDGWEKAGQVGQEIYGAGSAFGILVRHYQRIDQANMLIYCSYPLSDYQTEDGKVTFTIFGDPRLSCELRLMPIKGKKSPAAVLRSGDAVEKTDAQDEAQSASLSEKEPNEITPDGHRVFTCSGNQVVQISWEPVKVSSRNRKRGK